MNPLTIAGLVLLALLCVFALLGMVLARTRTLRVRTAPTYTRVCTALLLAATYGLTHYSWPGVRLRELDFWSLMVILGIAAYALIWAAVAYQLNKDDRSAFADSYMLSMLYRDSEQLPPETPPASGFGKKSR